ncbi:MAG: UDP-N-acetylmuramate--L-alanine ligase [Candidatus Omnitrophica bacterium]|nr:UDP-N-acetylmuramate--L-alanine ligase [Candidatus Omnitrophota bacterium]
MNKHYHLIGIGGIGMSGIAQLLLRQGMQVSGSDLRENKITGELKVLGAQIFIGHRASNIEGADIIVYSSAIKEGNPEVEKAKKLGIPLVMRAKALADLMQDKIVITIGGSHGKTTTTSLVSYLLLEAGLFPTVAVGGILRNIDTNACLGNGKFFVAEADESDGSFLYYNPKYSIVTNIDREHLDYYKDFKKEIAAFKEFINRTDRAGCVFYCADDENLKNIISGYKYKSLSFGLKENADIYPKNIKLEGLTSEFDCFYKDKFLERFNLPLGGEHNISNSLSLIVLGVELGIELKFIRQALSGYKGSGRRLEVKFNQNGYMVIDDYAHHPTELKATLKAAKNLNKERIVAIFQPHRYTRTQLLLDEFSESFDNTDYLIITDIYAASEPAIEGIDSKLLCQKIKTRFKDKKVHYLAKEEIAKHILGIIKKGDLVITLGAGDITKINDELVAGLKS